MRALVPVIALALALAASYPIHAEPSAGAPRVLADAGLIGEWALDCGRPAAMGNDHMVFAVDASGRATFLSTIGPDQINTYEIQAAEAAEPGLVRLDSILIRSGDRVVAEVVIKGDKFTVWNSWFNGRKVVEEGHVLDGDHPPAWFESCRK